MNKARLSAILTLAVICTVGISYAAYKAIPPKKHPINTPIPVSPATASSTEGHHPEAPSTVPSVPIPVEPVKPAKLPTASGEKPPQFVVLSFDGSKSLDMWKQTTDFAHQLTAQGKPLHFTYFISGVYFLTSKTKNQYLPPQHATGTSAIGYGASDADITARVAAINQAIADGNEIGSHANGHFDGTHWTKAEWLSELSQFDHLTKQAGKLELPNNAYTGFRAPELGRSLIMTDALKELGYRYDGSNVGKPDQWPSKYPNGLWSIPLAKITFGTTTSPILSMDYNFYMKQSKAKDTAKKGSAEWQLFYDQMMASYRQYFNTNYQGTRAPVIIGHHFSLWNDGVYWDVMKDFATEVCGKPEVHCVTFSELIAWLERQPQ